MDTYNVIVWHKIKVKNSRKRYSVGNIYRQCIDATGTHNRGIIKKR